MIRSIYILEGTGNIVFTKEYAEIESRATLVEFLVNLTSFLGTVGLEGKTEFMNLSTSRFFYAVRDEFTFIFIADKADDFSQIEEKVGQLVDIFMKEYIEMARTHQSLDGFDEKVDEIAVTMVKVAILGFAGVGKTTTLHLLRGETLPLVHDPTIGVSIKKLPEEVENANIVLWDLAGQSRFSILWAKMIANAQVVVIVTDSTLENVLRSKKLVSLVKEEVPDAKIIGIANKQDLPTALTPERVGQILGVGTYELVAIDISYRDRLIQIIRRAILEGKSEKKDN
ncbi:MAG: GTP-binding protein [Candidatus Thorarchaeota archaeon]|nr:GTP-binding protein [Candidatus Thorarchaeota archaeon]MCK5238783.1 GTP-binding protein [Candidatus Thorarchaeota archaeon]